MTSNTVKLFLGTQESQGDASVTSNQHITTTRARPTMNLGASGKQAKTKAKTKAARCSHAARGLYLGFLECRYP